MRSARCRQPRAGGWRVRARVERFAEAAALLLLRERPGAHGFELLAELSDLVPGARVDMGNLYRLLRSLEDEGVVVSEWDESAPGPARRRYRLTPAGERLLGEWAEALAAARDRIDAFLRRHEERR